MDRLFFELIDRIDEVVSEEIGDALLLEIARKFQLSHVSYLGINLPQVKDNTYIVTTYSDQWVHRYVSQDYVSIDPVVQVGLRGILPLDWKEVRAENPEVKRFFGESVEFGLGRQGMSFPLRGAVGETALFSINIDCSDREWKSEKRRLIREFQIIAGHFHTRMMDKLGITFEPIKLSKAQIECLKWTSAGKTAEDVGVILGISERMVRFYLEDARAKLGTINTVQAVARAIKLGLI